LLYVTCYRSTGTVVGAVVGSIVGLDIFITIIVVICRVCCGTSRPSQPGTVMLMQQAQPGVAVMRNYIMKYTNYAHFYLTRYIY